MPQAKDASSYVHEGLWTNWTKGMPLGATLTLTPTNAAILIAIVAIYVQFMGTQLWKIVVFILHQYRATQAERDGLYHQQQVILRNSASEFSTLWQLLRVATAWRHHTQMKPGRRSLVLVGWTFLHFAAFNVAGIFSSRLLAAGDAVLSRSPFCGEFNNTYYESLGTSQAISMPNQRNVEYFTNCQVHYQQSQQYVQFCSNPSSACKELPQQNLHWNWTIQDGCPFDPRVCSPKVKKSIVMDTGLISSHRHLGLNAPVPDRIQYRKVTTCTLLNDEKYISDWKNLSATANSPAKRVVDAYYGPNPIADRNATYSFSEWSQYYSFDQYSDTNPYQINVQYATAGDTTGIFSTFIPIAELARNDADLFLVFLSFSKVYESPVSDPWFLAQTPRPYPTPDRIGPVNGTVYTRDRPVTTLACAEQHQICVHSDSPSAIPKRERCTPLTGWYKVSTGPQSADSLNLTARQYSTVTRVFQSALDSSFAYVVKALAQRDTPLLARRSVQGLMGIGLPGDQWQQEARYWSSICMANLQRSVIDYSTGQFAADTAYINDTRSPAQQWLCRNQIIRGTPYQSFNFFALILITVVGLIIIIAGLTIEDCTAAWRERRSLRGRRTSSFKQDMWVKNGMLEMLRIVFECQSRTIWGHSSNGIPVSAPGQMMRIADLDSSDRILHPQIQELRPPRDRYSPSTSTTNTGAVTPLMGRRFPSMEEASGTQIPADQANFENHERWYASLRSANAVNHADAQNHDQDLETATATQLPYLWGSWGERPRPVPQIDFHLVGRAY